MAIFDHSYFRYCDMFQFVYVRVCRKQRVLLMSTWMERSATHSYLCRCFVFIHKRNLHQPRLLRRNLPNELSMCIWLWVLNQMNVELRAWLPCRLCHFNMSFCGLWLHSTSVLSVRSTSSSSNDACPLVCASDCRINRLMLDPFYSSFFM